MFPSQLVWLKSAFILHDQRANGLGWAAAQALSPHNLVKTARVYMFMHVRMWIKGTCRALANAGWLGGVW